MLAIFLETLNITAPVFAMLFLGVLLKRIDWINDNFIHTASALVFNVSMPALLFLGILHADLHAALQPALLIYFAVATLVSFALAWGWAIIKCPREDRGIYTQGAFRGNNGVIGLALAASMYGDYGISLGAILAALPGAWKARSSPATARTKTSFCFANRWAWLPGFCRGIFRFS